MKLRKNGTIAFFWCPGCEQLHGVNVDPEDSEDNRPRWKWDGSMDAPSFEPSILCFTSRAPDGSRLPEGQRRTLCHFFVRGGMIEFCGDSPHKLSGKTVPLPDIPAGYFSDA